MNACYTLNVLTVHAIVNFFAFIIKIVVCLYTDEQMQYTATTNTTTTTTTTTTAVTSSLVSSTATTSTTASVGVQSTAPAGKRVYNAQVN